MEAYIVDGVRTAIGSFGGSLAPVRADDLAALVIQHLVEKYTFDKVAIDDVILGCVNQAGDDNRNVARMASLLAGLPVTVPGETINRLCASGMSAVIHASRAIKAGDGHLFIAGGVEHMTRSPYVISKATKAFGTDAQMVDSSFGWRFINPRMEAMYGVEAMGKTAENLAEMYHITREDQDLYAYHSQMKANEASISGRLAKEIVSVPLSLKGGETSLFEKDEFIKAHTTTQKLSTLKAAFKKDGTVTAGNASGLNDGAAALLVCSDYGLNTHKLQPLARIAGSSVVGVEPRIMGIGPVEASLAALKKSGLSLNDIDHIEINEAFAAQVLACTRKLGLQDNDPRINPNGGAIALGHPLGMSGARILYSAALQLSLQQKKYALVTMCIGVGQGYAVILERV